MLLIKVAVIMGIGHSCELISFIFKLRLLNKPGEARADADAEDTAGPRSEALPDAEAATE